MSPDIEWQKRKPLLINQTKNAVRIQRFSVTCN